MKLFSLLFAGLALAKEELTGAEFKAEVAKGPVFAKFYAPWCGHCKEFDATFKKVAKKMTKTNENIVFGSMDGTSNDIPYMFPPLKGYPSVFFLSAYEKFDPIQYQGDRSYKSVKDWINRHSSIFLTEEERTGK